MKQKIDKHYVSEIDKRLAEFDRTHTKSASQQAEIDKYATVIELRDNPKATKKKDRDIWEEF